MRGHFFNTLRFRWMCPISPLCCDCHALTVWQGLMRTFAHTLAHFPLGSFIFELTQALLVLSVRKKEREREELQLSEGVKDSLKGNAEQVTPAQLQLSLYLPLLSLHISSTAHPHRDHPHTHTHTPPCVCLSPPQGSVCELMAVSLCRCDGKQLLHFSAHSLFFFSLSPSSCSTSAYSWK